MISQLINVGRLEVHYKLHVVAQMKAMTELDLEDMGRSSVWLDSREGARYLNSLLMGLVLNPPSIPAVYALSRSKHV